MQLYNISYTALYVISSDPIGHSLSLISQILSDSRPECYEIYLHANVEKSPVYPSTRLFGYDALI